MKIPIFSNQNYGIRMRVKWLMKQPALNNAVGINRSAKYRHGWMILELGLTGMPNNIT